jgi:hypothetical protein
MSEEPPLDGPENPQGQPPGDSPGQAPWSNPRGKKPFWRRTAFLMAAPPLALVMIIVIVGCVSSSTSSPASSPSAAGSPSAAAGSPSGNAAGSPSANAAGSPSANAAGSPSGPPAPPSALTCGSPADPTGVWLKNNPTVQYVIYSLSQIEPDIASGNVSPDEVNVLQLVAVAWNENSSQNYSGKLARDTYRFAHDVDNYAGLDVPLNQSYAPKVDSDIARLVSDCPGA